MNRKIISLLILLYPLIQLYPQSFFEDGSMKLTEVSNNKKYGYEPNYKTAIKVGKIQNERAFLEALLGPNGEAIQYSRVGSCCEFKSKKNPFGSSFLDKYKIHYEGLKEPIFLYLNGYDFDTPKCPYGFTFKSANNIEKPTIYPQEKVIHVVPCNKNQTYSVDYFLLKETIGSLPSADNNPKYKLGSEALTEYFGSNPLTDKRAQPIMFKVSIGFVVNCKGEAGNFQILTKGKGLLETLANQVLERVNNIPENWIPADKDGEAVDCYQVLSFTVLNGKLNKVTYN